MSDEVKDYLAALPDDRRAVVQRFHDLIRAAVPDLDVRVWDYGGGLIGYGTYRYRNTSTEGEWFALGVGNRKRFVSLYANATKDGGYILEHYVDRLPGVKLQRSCVNITKPELLDDAVITELARETAAAFAGQYLHES